MLSFEEHHHGDVTRLVVQGHLTAEVEAQMLARNEDLVGRGRTRVVLDLGGVDFIDSSGIGAIVSLFKRARLVQGDVKIAGLAGQPREIFRLLRFDRAFEVYDTPARALAAFASGA